MLQKKKHTMSEVSQVTKHEAKQKHFISDGEKAELVDLKANAQRKVACASRAASDLLSIVSQFSSLEEDIQVAIDMKMFSSEISMEMFNDRFYKIARNMRKTADTLLECAGHSRYLDITPQSSSDSSHPRIGMLKCASLSASPTAGIPLFSAPKKARKSGSTLPLPIGIPTDGDSVALSDDDILLSSDEDSEDPIRAILGRRTPDSRSYAQRKMTPTASASIDEDDFDPWKIPKKPMARYPNITIDCMSAPASASSCSSSGSSSGSEYSSYSTSATDDDGYATDEEWKISDATPDMLKSTSASSMISMSETTPVLESTEIAIATIEDSDEDLDEEAKVCLPPGASFYFSLKACPSVMTPTCVSHSLAKTARKKKMTFGSMTPKPQRTRSRKRKAVKHKTSKKKRKRKVRASAKPKSTRRKGRKKAKRLDKKMGGKKESGGKSAPLFGRSTSVCSSTGVSICKRMSSLSPQHSPVIVTDLFALAEDALNRSTGTGTRGHGQMGKSLSVLIPSPTHSPVSSADFENTLISLKTTLTPLLASMTSEGVSPMGSICWKCASGSAPTRGKRRAFDCETMSESTLKECSIWIKYENRLIDSTLKQVRRDSVWLRIETEYVGSVTQQFSALVNELRKKQKATASALRRHVPVSGASVKGPSKDGSLWQLRKERAEKMAETVLDKLQNHLCGALVGKVDAGGLVYLTGRAASKPKKSGATKAVPTIRIMQETVLDCKLRLLLSECKAFIVSCKGALAAASALASMKERLSLLQALKRECVQMDDLTQAHLLQLRKFHALATAKRELTRTLLAQTAQMAQALEEATGH